MWIRVKEKRIGALNWQSLAGWRGSAAASLTSFEPEPTLSTHKHHMTSNQDPAWASLTGPW